MDFQKKNLRYGDRVRIIKTQGGMDGVEATITGIASIHWFDVYILTLDFVMETNAKVMPKFTTVTIPETCLERIDS